MTPTRDALRRLALTAAAALAALSAAACRPPADGIAGTTDLPEVQARRDIAEAEREELRARRDLALAERTHGRVVGERADSGEIDLR
jgi:hypothetical protein